MYVGMTHDASKRFDTYRRVASRKKETDQRLLSDSLARYGWDDHEVSILRSAIPTKSEAFVWERYYINKLDTFLTTHGLNLTRGGGGVDNWTADRRKEHARLMRFLMSTNVERQDRMRATCRSEAYRASHSEIMAAVYAAKDNHHFDTPVLQKSLDGQHIATYDSIRKAADATGSRADKISACMNGRRQTHNGYLWERL